MDKDIDKDSLIIIGSDITKTKGKSMKSGYVSYLNSYIRLGSIHEILEVDLNNEKKFEVLGMVFTSNVLDRLKSGKVYRMLVSLKYEVDGFVKGSSLMNSVMITSSTSCKLILEWIQRELRRFEDEYDLEDYSGDCFVGWKEWLSSEDYAAGVTNKKVDEIVSEVLLDEVKSKNKYKKISKNMLDGQAFESINNFNPLFDSVVKGNK